MGDSRVADTEIGGRLPKAGRSARLPDGSFEVFERPLLLGGQIKRHGIPLHLNVNIILYLFLPNRIKRIFSNFV